MEPTMNDSPNKDSHSELEEKLEVEAELLTQNIYELLSCDLQMYLLTFLTMGDLYQISLSCKHGEFLVLSAEADCFVWKMMAHHLGFNKQETIRSLVQELHVKDEAREELALFNVNGDAPPNMWRELVHSNLIKWDANTRTPDSDIKMHNNDKTISCVRESKWDTIRTNRKLEMGLVHGWEYALDEHDNGGYNAYRIFVGIERGTYAFTEVGTDKIIGYSSQGVGYNIGQHSVHREHSYGLDDRSVLYEEGFKFSSGDTIAFKFDLKNLSTSNTATMYLFKNNQYFMTIADIPTQDIVYYPAISVIGCQRVSIRMKRPSTLDTTNRTQISQI